MKEGQGRSRSAGGQNAVFTLVTKMPAVVAFVALYFRLLTFVVVFPAEFDGRTFDVHGIKHDKNLADKKCFCF